MSAQVIANFLDKGVSGDINVIHMVNASRGSPATRRHQKKEAEIIKTAAGLVERSGIDSLTTSALADAVDLSPAALYRYFPAKEAIVAALVADLLAGLEDRYQRLQAALGLGPAQPRALASLLLAARCAGELAALRPRRFELLRWVAAGPFALDAEPSREPVRLHLMSLLGLCAQGLEAARRCGALAPEDDPGVPDEPSLAEEEDIDLLRAWQWAFALHGLLSSASVAARLGRPFAPEAQALALARTLLLGHGAPAGALASAERLAAAAQRSLGPISAEPVGDVTPPPPAPPPRPGHAGPGTGGEGGGRRR